MIVCKSSRPSQFLAIQDWQNLALRLGAELNQNRYDDVLAVIWPIQSVSCKDIVTMGMAEQKSVPRYISI